MGTKTHKLKKSDFNYDFNPFDWNIRPTNENQFFY